MKFFFTNKTIGREQFKCTYHAQVWKQLNCERLLLFFIFVSAVNGIIDVLV